MAVETAVGGAAPDQTLAAAHAALLKARDLQFAFDASPQAKPPPDWLIALLKALEPLAPVLKYALWAGLAAGAVLILWLVLREFISLPLGGKRKAAKAPALQPDAAVALTLLEDADRLAAQERFAEAVHALLFRSVDDINRRRPGAVKPALTGRDISRLAAIPEEPRGAFGRIAQVVEHSLFGGRDVDGETFRRCRQDYQTFAFSEAWR